jgi:hypothetical protein
VPIAQGSQTQLTYVAETTWGTTPSTPAMAILPVATARIRRDTKSADVQVLRGDRQVEDYYYGARTAFLDIEYVLRGAVFDYLLQMALFGTLGSPVASTIRGGVVRKSATFEVMHTDIGQYETIVGAMCTSWTLTIGEDGYLRCKQSFVGKTYGLTGTSLDATPDAASLANIYRVTTVLLDSAPVAACVGVEVGVDNRLQPVWPVTSRDPVDIFDGRAKVAGSLSVLFEDAANLTRFLAETDTQVVVVAPAATRTLTLLLPRAKLTSAESPVDGEQAVVEKFGFQALYDGSVSTSIQIAFS